MNTILFLMMGTYFINSKVKITTIPQTGNNQIITVETESGHEFAFNGNGFEVGDSVVLFMDNKGTMDITDDEVYDAFLQ